MNSKRWLQALHSLGLEFLLPLPLLGFAFWFGGGLITERLLSRTYSTTSKLQADEQSKVRLAVSVVIIKAEIDKEQGFTKVEAKTTDSLRTKVEFQFPVTELSIVEDKIAQKLSLSRENVRKLVRYKIKSQRS